MSGLRLTLLLLILVGAASVSLGQITEPRSVFPPPEREDDKPTSLKETMQKLRVDRERKEHDQMITRGEEALKLAEEVERSVENAGRLTNSDLSKISNVEKLVKKIRSDLGGKDGDDDEDAESISPNNVVEAVKALRETTATLYDELKKTTRFTISAAAINTSNAAIRVVKFLRFVK